MDASKMDTSKMDVQITKDTVTKTVNQTQLQHNVFHIRWTIPNVSDKISSVVDATNYDEDCDGDSEYNEDDRLKSDVFKMDEDLDDTFHLELHCFDEGGDSIGLQLNHEENANSWDVGCKFWIECPDGKKFKETEVKTHEFSSRVFNILSYYLPFKSFLTQKDLKNSNFVKNDCLVICGELKQRVAQKVYPKMSKKECKKLWSSYQQGLIDNVIIQVDGKDVEIPKMVPQVNYKFIEYLMSIESCKKVENVIIEVKETKYEAMKAFIDFMHHESVENLEDICDDLFLLADKYRDVGLEDYCLRQMKNSLNKENVFERLKLAFLHDQKELKEAAIEYITKPNSDFNVRQIMKSLEWANFVVSNGELAEEIADALFDKMNLFAKKECDKKENAENQDEK